MPTLGDDLKLVDRYVRYWRKADISSRDNSAKSTKCGVRGILRYVRAGHRPTLSFVSVSGC